MNEWTNERTPPRGITLPEGNLPPHLKVEDDVTAALAVKRPVPAAVLIRPRVGAPQHGVPVGLAPSPRGLGFVVRTVVFQVFTSVQGSRALRPSYFHFQFRSIRVFCLFTRLKLEVAPLCCRVTRSAVGFYCW